jgi:hypothetical protein
MYNWAVIEAAYKEAFASMADKDIDWRNTSAYERYIVLRAREKREYNYRGSHLYEEEKAK